MYSKNLDYCVEVQRRYEARIVNLLRNTSAGNDDLQNSNGVRYKCADSNRDIHQAIERLSAGSLVVFPTETVYGLGGDAEQLLAIDAIYQLKQRPRTHPLIVHVHQNTDLNYWAHTIPQSALRLIDVFWPGPLSLILPRAAHIPAQVSGGQATIGLRAPNHPLTCALLAEFKKGRGGIAGPSANLFGRVSPTRAEHVLSGFSDSQAFYLLDGGSCIAGIESTILDLTRAFPEILRPGVITAQAIAEVIGMVPLTREIKAIKATKNQPQVSGSYRSHYAPRTPLYLCSAQQLRLWTAEHTDMHRSLACAAMALSNEFAEIADQAGFICYHLPQNPQQLAHDFYHVLHQFDQKKLALIFFEQLPKEAEWLALNDRIWRAAKEFEEKIIKL